MTIEDDIVQVLLSNTGRQAPRQRVIEEVENRRAAQGYTVPFKFEEVVQSVYNRNCVDYEPFRERKVPDAVALFDSPGGKWSGVWGINRMNPRFRILRRRKELKKRR